MLMNNPAAGADTRAERGGVACDGFFLAARLIRCRQTNGLSCLLDLGEFTSLSS